MSIENAVKFLQRLSSDEALGELAQQASTAPNAPAALASLATGCGLPCTAADWASLAQSCMPDTPTLFNEQDQGEATRGAAAAPQIWHLMGNAAAEELPGSPAGLITRVVRPNQEAVAAEILGNIADSVGAVLPFVSARQPPPNVN